MGNFPFAIVAFLLLWVQLTSLRQSAPIRDEFSVTAFVSCLDENGNSIGSRRVRSPVLVSPDGNLRAFAEAEVTARPAESSGTQGAGPPCKNLTRVYLTRSGNSTPQLIYVQEPTEDTPGNGIELTDWSADGRYLLMTGYGWVYEGDSFDFGIVIYDTRTGATIRPDTNKLFSHRFGKECVVELHAVGFTENSAVLIDAWDSPEDITGNPGCLGKKGRWQVEWGKVEIQELKEDQPIRRFGRVER